VAVVRPSIATPVGESAGVIYREELLTVASGEGGAYL
jgi:hypothetical protein